MSLFKKKLPEMVKYWMKQDFAEAKVIVASDGHYELHIDGEKYPFPGYPRSGLLYGSLSPVKHLVKNRLFNYGWKLLEDKQHTPREIIALLRNELDTILRTIDSGKPADADSREITPFRYDMLPFERLNPPIKELWRAFTVLETKRKSPTIKALKELLCFILQEDDAYRFRFQWMAQFFNPNTWWRRLLKRDTVKDFTKALSLLEHGEVVSDMKERQRLLTRILSFVLTDPHIKECFLALAQELDWKKLVLTKADKYYFRAKYFKVDYPNSQY